MCSYFHRVCVSGYWLGHSHISRMSSIDRGRGIDGTMTIGYHLHGECLFFAAILIFIHFIHSLDRLAHGMWTFCYFVFFFVICIHGLVLWYQFDLCGLASLELIGETMFSESITVHDWTRWTTNIYMRFPVVFCGSGTEDLRNSKAINWLAFHHVALSLVDKAHEFSTFVSHHQILHCFVFINTIRIWVSIILVIQLIIVQIVQQGSRYGLFVDKLRFGVVGHDGLCHVVLGLVVCGHIVLGRHNTGLIGWVLFHDHAHLGQVFPHYSASGCQSVLDQIVVEWQHQLQRSTAFLEENAKEDKL